ncbi:RNA polymerase sigma factor [Burkholderiaceae bacterium UC74_6]
MIKDLQHAFAKVKAALMRRGRTEHDAEDLLQEAWIRFSIYEREQVVDKPDALLMKVALNLSIDRHRAELTRGEEVMLEDVVLIDTAPAAEDVLLARERMQRLSLCLGRLSEKTRTIFLAYRLEGRSYKEIAQSYGVSTSTVEKHVARATMLLTDWMDGW